MIRTNTIGWVALTLAIIGALNWGLIGLFGFNLVAAVFGEMSVLSRIVYLLVGLAALTLIIEAFTPRHHPTSTTGPGA